MRNSSLVEWFCAENVTGLKSTAEAPDLGGLLQDGRGAFLVHRSRTVRNGGARGSDNAGISNDKTSENLVRRKPKVS